MIEKKRDVRYNMLTGERADNMSLNKEYINTFPFNPFEFPFNIEESGITESFDSYVIERSKCHCFIIEYVVSGKGTVICNNKKYRLKSGDVCILPKGSDHKYYPDSGGWKKIWFNIDGILVESLLTAFSIKDKILFSNFDRSDLFEEMYKITCDRNRPPEAIFYDASEYFFKIIKHIHIIGTVSSQNNKLIEIKHIIDNSVYNKNFRIKDIARRLLISEKYITNLFKNAFNITPYNYYLKKKAEAAAAMLLTTEMSSAEIAEKLSFTDSAHFTKAFKSRYGMTPNKYRKTNIKSYQNHSNRTNKENTPFVENSSFDITYMKH